MDRPPSPVSVNPAGRARAVRTVSSDASFGISNVFIQLLTLELPGFAIYLKQPTGKIYPLLEYYKIHVQGTMTMK